MKPPTVLYGTAWKEGRTAVLTEPALRAVLQTKFTYRRGQDDRLPYDPDASLATQFAQSLGFRTGSSPGEAGEGKGFEVD